MPRSIGRVVVIVVASMLAAGAVCAETLQAKGAVTIPPPEAQEDDSLEAIPLTKLEGESITVTFKMKVSHSGDSDSRQSMLVLYVQYRVAEGAELSSRLDFAFYDEDGGLIHTWETTEYSVSNTEADDPDSFPTWIVFEASDDWGLSIQSFDAVRSCQVVLRTFEG